MSDDLEHYTHSYATGHRPWDSGVPSQELMRVADAGLLPGKTVLELGCGTGTNALELHRRGYHVTAVDFVAQAIYEARAKAHQANAEGIEFRVGDATKDDFGGPYDVLFDRGTYHHVRSVNLQGFLNVLERSSRKGTRWLSLAASANETRDPFPWAIREAEMRAELEPRFEILELREFRFDTRKADFRPLAWSILMKRK